LYQELGRALEERLLQGWETPQRAVEAGD